MAQPARPKKTVELMSNYNGFFLGADGPVLGTDWVEIRVMASSTVELRRKYE